MVVVSGNRPLEVMQKQTARYAFFDGRLKDLGSKLPFSLMPVISDNWNKHFSWKGEGAMPQDERDELTAIVGQAKQGGYLVRFWATPDAPGKEREAVWEELKQAGVGLIGTDDLDGLKVFLQNK
jgi:glycerophosphoryl diester phosphodiesterase